ncbi:prepilin-type N-terminal cleavage/methylation domain-containing protein [Halieaceae bacterium IMCC14734]|uniref:Prepilin-type N-terminal cleavage/methylation domain-containing protein n=1 Tax=Candidatus Litorirhabdus singularis TaxID=2518993 RepID=A0ABT3TLJ6_9GAMM|nr:type IV pilin protein [Candidatus Litorirhabdus singularis]MCX2983203.1 prepilin-type N-terminal cleavage/methylation domain-containing protein [Candidatus Litorirhabdus singularis]
MKFGDRKIAGFTIIEMLIVLVIMGILAAAVLPTYQSSVSKARRADGKSALLDLGARSEKFFAQNSTYTTEISGGSGLNLGRTTSSDGYYNLSIAACGGGTIARCYQITAAATGAQSGDTECSQLRLDNVGRKTSLNSSGGATEYCWK